MTITTIPPYLDAILENHPASSQGRADALSNLTREQLLDIIDSAKQVLSDNKIKDDFSHTLIPIESNLLIQELNFLSARDKAYTKDSILSMFCRNDSKKTFSSIKPASSIHWNAESGYGEGSIIDDGAVILTRLNRIKDALIENIDILDSDVGTEKKQENIAKQEQKNNDFINHEIPKDSGDLIEEINWLSKSQKTYKNTTLLEEYVPNENNDQNHDFFPDISAKKSLRWKDGLYGAGHLLYIEKITIRLDLIKTALADQIDTMQAEVESQKQQNIQDKEYEKEDTIIQKNIYFINHKISDDLGELINEMNTLSQTRKAYNEKDILDRFVANDDYDFILDISAKKSVRWNEKDGYGAGHLFDTQIITERLNLIKVALSGKIRERHDKLKVEEQALMQEEKEKVDKQNTEFITHKIPEQSLELIQELSELSTSQSLLTLQYIVDEHIKSSTDENIVEGKISHTFLSDIHPKDTIQWNPISGYTFGSQFSKDIIDQRLQCIKKAIKEYAPLIQQEIEQRKQDDIAKFKRDLSGNGYADLILKVGDHSDSLNTYNSEDLKQLLIADAQKRHTILDVLQANRQPGDSEKCELLKEKLHIILDTLHKETYKEELLTVHHVSDDLKSPNTSGEDIIETLNAYFPEKDGQPLFESGTFSQKYDEILAYSLTEFQAFIENLVIVIDPTDPSTIEIQGVVDTVLDRLRERYMSQDSVKFYLKPTLTQQLIDDAKEYNPDIKIGTLDNLEKYTKQNTYEKYVSDILILRLSAHPKLLKRKERTKGVQALINLVNALYGEIGVEYLKKELAYRRKKREKKATLKKDSMQENQIDKAYELLLLNLSDNTANQTETLVKNISSMYNMEHTDNPFYIKLKKRKHKICSKSRAYKQSDISLDERQRGILKTHKCQTIDAHKNLITITEAIFQDILIDYLNHGVVEKYKILKTTNYDDTIHSIDVVIREIKNNNEIGIDFIISKKDNSINKKKEKRDVTIPEEYNLYKGHVLKKTMGRKVLALSPDLMSKIIFDFFEQAENSNNPDSFYNLYKKHTGNTDPLGDQLKEIGLIDDSK